MIRILIKYLFVLLLVFLVCQPAFTQVGKKQKTLPLHIDDQQWRPLFECDDESMQDQLQRRLNQDQHWKRLMHSRRMSVGLVDLSDPAHVRFASVNGDLMMYAASLPKIAVLLAAYQALEDHRIQETATVLKDTERMIRRSDNAAATRLIDALGYKYIAAVLTDPDYRFYDLNHGGGLWVGKRYARSGARNPDPLKGLSHAASVNQVCRFYYLLATDRLLSEKRNRQMLASLSNTAIKHKFVYALNRVAPDAQLYRKSGTWRAWHSDSVLVIGPDWRCYVLVALLEDGNGEQCLRDLVPVAESVLQSSR